MMQSVSLSLNKQGKNYAALPGQNSSLAAWAVCCRGDACRDAVPALPCPRRVLVPQPGSAVHAEEPYEHPVLPPEHLTSGCSSYFSIFLYLKSGLLLACSSCWITSLWAWSSWWGLCPTLQSTLQAAAPPRAAHSHAGTGRPGCCAPVLLSPRPSDPGSPSMKVFGLVLH